MKNKVLGAVAAVLALAVACTLVWKHQAAEKEKKAAWKNVIAYVPLDDRTDNMEDVVYVAEASGYRVVMPEGDIYCTKLDGQNPNANGTQYGDRAALLEWVREMDKQGCDLFILSLDQLFSGGLVSSRAMYGENDLTFADGTVMTEVEAFDKYIYTLAKDKDNRIYLFDSIVRLASTVAYQGFGLEEYYGLREYGMVARPVLEGSDLTLENVFANYPYAADGITAAEEALGDNTYRAALTEDIIDHYLAVRRRKLTLLDHVVTRLNENKNGNTRLLIGIDDSSNTTNIQYNEIHYIESRLGEGSKVMAGLDSLARLLVGEIAQDTYDYTIRGSVRYVGGTQSIPSSEFDRFTLEEVVDLHMELYEIERVAEQDAELQIVVMTAPEDKTAAAAYCEELVSLLEHNQTHDIPTLFIEASNNAYGKTLENMLLERVDFAHLVAFAGKYDQANVTGAGFAMGISRYLYLRCCGEKTDRADVVQVQQIANSMALTYPYILSARYPLNVYIRDMGYDYNNILAEGEDRQLIQQKLEELFLPGCEVMGGNLEGTAVISDLMDYTEKTVGAVTYSDVYMPWNRTFEISFTVTVAPLTPAA